MLYIYHTMIAISYSKDTLMLLFITYLKLEEIFLTKLWPGRSGKGRSFCTDFERLL